MLLSEKNKWLNGGLFYGKFFTIESESDIGLLAFHPLIMNSSEVESKSDARFLKEVEKTDWLSAQKWPIKISSSEVESESDLTV